MAESNLFARYDNQGDVLHLSTGSREPTAIHRLDDALFVEKGICSREVVGLVILGYEKFFRTGPEPSWLPGGFRLPEAMVRFLSERPQFRASDAAEPDFLDQIDTYQPGQRTEFEYGEALTT